MSEQEKREALEAVTEGMDKTQQAILMAYANGLKAGTEIEKALAKEKQEASA